MIYLEVSVVPFLTPPCGWGGGSSKEGEIPAGGLLQSWRLNWGIELKDRMESEDCFLNFLARYYYS